MFSKELKQTVNCRVELVPTQPHSDEMNSTKHSGGGSGRLRIQRPPAQTAGQVETATSSRFAALQTTQMEGVEATDPAATDPAIT